MTVAFIQARMGSTRLPGKVLTDICGRPMLWHLWWRVSQSKLVDRVVVATGDDPRNQPLVAFCETNGIPYFVGSEQFVLDRIHGAAKTFGADLIVSVTGDCPLVDPAVVDRIVEEQRRHAPDLCTTSSSFTHPDGFGVEVFPFQTLERAHAEVVDPMEREHLTLHIRRRRDKFRIRFVEHWSYHPFTDAHLSVDDEHDLKLVTRIFEALHPRRPLFGIDDVIETLRHNPDWMAEHPGTPINEGYLAGLLDRFERQPSPRADLGLMDFSRASGGRVPDDRGNVFIDTVMSHGEVSVGHQHPDVELAASRAASAGAATYRQLCGELTARFARALPHVEAVSYWRNSVDAFSAAIRTIRNVTGRPYVLTGCESGNGDGLQSSFDSFTQGFAYGDLDTLQKRLTERAGHVGVVVLAPVRDQAPPDGYLQSVLALTHQHGALLMFDETDSGLRICPGGAAQFFGVTPDLTCFARGIANGYSIAALAGPRDIVERHGSSRVVAPPPPNVLAAAIASMDVLDRESGTSVMWSLGRKIKDAYNFLSKRYGLLDWTVCHGFPPVARVTFRARLGSTDARYAELLRRECLRRGVLFDGAPRLCLSHTDAQIESTIGVLGAAVSVLAEASRAGDPERFIDRGRAV